MRYLPLLVITVFLSISCNKDDCSRPDQCSEVPEAGPCEAYIPSYYYDKEDGKCKEFIYGGCGGNVPYETLEACWDCECDKRLE